MAQKKAGMSRTLTGAAFFLAMAGGVASADTTYRFHWDHGETTFFKFASNDWLAESTNEDGWDSDVDGSGNLTAFDGDDSSVARTTPYTVGGSTLKAKFIIDDVTGTVNLTNFTASWTFSGRVAFSASGGVVSEGTCTTSSFNVSFSGNYGSGTDSSSFVVPMLSGTGTQACSTHASDINDDLALGGSGAKLHFNKFVIEAL